MNIEGLFQAAFQYAERTIIKTQRQLPPTWTLINKNGENFVVITPWTNPTDKLLAEMQLRLEMQERKIIAYAFVIEAWSARAPEGWTPEKGGKLDQPSKRADRKEVVIASVHDGKTIHVRVWNIKRDWHDRAASLELTDGEANGFESWMTTLLEGSK